MRAYLGFIPIAMVGGPFLVATIRQALFYTGCMDGFGYVLVAMFAFVVGGAINVVFLLFVGITHRTYFTYADRRNRIMAKAGFTGSLLLLFIQAGVLASLALKKLAMD